ncbi:hypothetical protein B10525_17920 (plasmid) [Campylobacter jejuni]|nr:hypothetical protein B10525_17920 [Campylobacter jejuni]
MKAQKQEQQIQQTQEIKEPEKLKTKSLEDKNMHLIKVHIYSYYYLLIVTINNKLKVIF